MKVYIEKSKNRIQIKFPYHPEYVQRVKMIDGAYWAKSRKLWTVPLDLHVCQNLRKKFGDELVIGPELREWAETVIEFNKRVTEIGRMDSCVLPRVEALYPEISAAMDNRIYQTVGSAFVAEGRTVLLGDDVGLGKTLETFGGIIESELTGSFLVFCPKSATYSTWVKEVHKWLPDDYVLDAVKFTQKPKRRELLAQYFEECSSAERSWLICNIEMCRTKYREECPAHECDGSDDDCPSAKRHRVFRASDYPELFETLWSGVVFDESQKALIARTALLRKQTQVRVGAGKLPIAADGLRLAISSTPWRGKPENFWGTLNWLRPDLHSSYWRWAKRWFEVENNGYGQVIGEFKEGKEKAWYRELAPVMLKRKKREVAMDLIEPIIESVWLPMQDEQARQYQEFAKDLSVRVDGGEITAIGVLDAMTRLKQFAQCTWFVKNENTWTKAKPKNGDVSEKDKKIKIFPGPSSNKLQWVLDFLDSLGILDGLGTEKVLIASPSTKILNWLSEHLEKAGASCFLLTGETKGSERSSQVEDFQSDQMDTCVFLLNTFAGGVSLTLDAADNVIIFNETHVPDDQEQVVGRVDRVSRVHEIRVYYLRSLGTVEHSIGETNEHRDSVQKDLQDARRAVRVLSEIIKTE